MSDFNESHSPSTKPGQLHAVDGEVVDEAGVDLQPDTDETSEGSGTFASRGAIALAGAAGVAAVYAAEEGARSRR
jgi:hypothetical protein